MCVIKAMENKVNYLFIFEHFDIRLFGLRLIGDMRISFIRDEGKRLLFVYLVLK